jgi:hypothetical protein
VWILPCLVLLVHTALRRRSALLWAGTGLLALYNISWPMHPLSTPDKLLPLGFIWLAPHRDARQELSWNLAQSLVGNGIVLTGLAGVLLASGWILRTALRDRNGAGWWAPPKTDGKASQGEPA